MRIRVGIIGIALAILSVVTPLLVSVADGPTAAAEQVSGEVRADSLIWD